MSKLTTNESLLVWHAFAALRKTAERMIEDARVLGAIRSEGEAIMKIAEIDALRERIALENKK